MEALFAWSGGKDSAMALYELRKDRRYTIAALLTTITEDYDRISMHGVRRVLLEKQAASLGLPLEKISITKNASDREYEAKMRDVLAAYKRSGVSAVGFGDIFLEDLKRYREEKLAEVDMGGIFPIWKRDSRELARAFIDLGFKAIIVCVDSKALDKGLAGREFDEDLIGDLPPGVDPCGENGEFHTFVYDGPIFRKRISFVAGETVLRDCRFYYKELIPA